MSPENPHEATVVVVLVALLHGLGYRSEQITVLSAYVGQLLLIKTALHACALDKVQVSTVDAYQGEENDIVILSLVRSNADGKMGFTSVDNRVCVALSRARLGFYCVCNLRMLAASSQRAQDRSAGCDATLWQKLERHVIATGACGAALPLLRVG